MGLKFPKPFISTVTQKVKTGLFCKRNNARVINIYMFYLGCHEKQYCAAIRSFGHCDSSYVAYFKNLGVLTILQKICLLIQSHMLAHNYQSSYMSGFDSAGKLCFLGTWTSVFHGNHKVHGACKALVNLQFVFLSRCLLFTSLLGCCGSFVSSHCLCIQAFL